jgi:L-ascorbate metabolism protein UlaG (beta-lactamase superfamily)
MRYTGRRLERVASSRQFAAGRFVNRYTSTAERDPAVKADKPDLKGFLFGGEHRKPIGPLPAQDPREGWRRSSASGLRVTWLGHSTALLEIGGRRILTDPVWGRASPLSFLGPQRFQPVPIAINALPPLDAVLISHDHYDHLDRDAIRVLAKLGMPFVTSLGVGARLEGWGIPPERITELDWWEQIDLAGGLQITAAPAHHFSGRTVQDRNATLWSSFVLKDERHSVYFSGDTGLSPAFAEIGQRLGPFDLVMLEVGAFHPSWGAVHLGPDNAVLAWRDLGSGVLLPVHWGTFNLAMHPWYEPAERLIAEVAEGLLMPRLGQAVEPAQIGPVEPWWRDLLSRHRPLQERTSPCPSPVKTA